MTTIFIQLLLFSLFCRWMPVEGDGILVVRFVRYENPGGEGANGQCCDGRWGLCQRHGCDHKFTICLGHLLSSDDVTVDSCSFARKQTQAVKNQDNIDFGDDIRGTSNPMWFTADSIPSSFSLKVQVYDNDPSVNTDDLVDYLRLDVASSDRLTWQPGEVNSYQLISRTRLSVELSYRCNTHWYGIHCTVYCRPPTIADHYVCSQHNGEKICLTGWFGEECELPEVEIDDSDSTEEDEGHSDGDVGYTENPATNDSIDIATTITDDNGTGEDGDHTNGNEGYTETPATNDGIDIATTTTEATDSAEITTLATELPDLCGDDICVNGVCATSDSGEGQYCLCDAGFTGRRCELSGCEGFCSPGECLITESTGIYRYTCLCPPPYILVTLSEDYDHDGYPVRCQLPTIATSPATTTPSEQWYDRPNADCDTLAHHGLGEVDSVYDIQPIGGAEPIPVYCKMTSGRWTVIQRRVDGNVNFNRGWDDYRTGFGEAGANSNFWLGLENLHHLTHQRQYKLRIEMQLSDETWRHAEYDTFNIDNESNSYAIHVTGYHGNAGDSLQFTGHGGTRLHNGMPFSTSDRDHDRWEAGNCAQDYLAGWWYNDCFWANLNGLYVESDGVHKPPCHQGHCIPWLTISGYRQNSLVHVIMMVKPQTSLSEDDDWNM